MVQRRLGRRSLGVVCNHHWVAVWLVDAEPSAAGDDAPTEQQRLGYHADWRGEDCSAVAEPLPAARHLLPAGGLVVQCLVDHGGLGAVRIGDWPGVRLLDVQPSARRGVAGSLVRFSNNKSNERGNSPTLAAFSCCLSHFIVWAECLIALSLYSSDHP